MTRKLTLASVVVLLAGLALMADTEPARTQAGGTPATLTVGIYTPTVEFANSAERLQYIKRLAKALEAATGAKVQGSSYASLGSLKKARPDFAIIDAQCYATNLKWELLANGQIDGKSTQKWALFSRVGGGMPGLKGQKLSYVKMGCRDEDFLMNAMLETEVSSKHFSGKVGKPTLQGAIADVASFKAASAVFAPVGSQKGLEKVFDTTTVPGPAFVVVNSKLNNSTVKKVKDAVVGFGGGGAISGWTGGNDGPYKSLKGKMARNVKRPVFAQPSPVKLSGDDVIKNPDTLDDSALTAVKQHFEEPPKRQ
jgi:hypothetical protein